MWIHVHVSSSKMIRMLDELGPKTISGEGSQCLCWRQRLKTVIEINNLSTLCLESSSRMWSQLRRERLHFGNTPRWKLRPGVKSRCWERSFKRLSKRVTSCTFKQLSWSTWRCHNVTINLNIVNNAGGTSTVQRGNQTPVVGSATDSDFEYVTPWCRLWSGLFSVCWVQSRVLGHWALSLAQWREFWD